jgi:hygromycin-B 7''-O-kinase
MSKSSSEGDDSAAVVDAIRRDLSLGVGIKRFASGSIPVFAVGDEHVVKLFPLTDRSFVDTEMAVLTRIDGQLSIPTPRAIAAGERGQWLYIVMTRLSGCSLAEAWPAIEIRDRLQVVREVGAPLAALHATTTDELAPLAVDWPRFMDAQRASCRDRQLARGLAAPWVDAVDAFLARWTPSNDAAPVLLHTEVMREHLLVERREGAWHLSGLVDFEPAMLGAPEYELAAVGIFLTCAEPGLLRAYLTPTARKWTTSSRCESWPTRSSTGTATCAGIWNASRSRTSLMIWNRSRAGGSLRSFGAGRLASPTGFEPVLPP